MSFNGSFVWTLSRTAAATGHKTEDSVTTQSSTLNTNINTTLNTLFSSWTQRFKTFYAHKNDFSQQQFVKMCVSELVFSANIIHPPDRCGIKQQGYYTGALWTGHNKTSLWNVQSDPLQSPGTALLDIPAANMSLSLCCEMKHLEWPLIVSSLNNTCAINPAFIFVLSV